MTTLRRFHNAVKMKTLTDAVRGRKGLTLIDIGCGPATDGHKWNISGFSNVLALDNSEAAIQEARKRFPTCGFRFVICPNVCTSLARYYGGRLADIVTCNFAIHYLMGNIEGLLDGVRDVLRTGGTFLGAVLNGDRVRRLVGPKGTFESNLVQISATGENTVNFLLKGSSYYFGRTGSSLETLVRPEDIICPSLSRKMHLMYWKAFTDLLSPKGYTDEELQVSRLYDVFAFRRA
jgi:SAM-dependent methyltransferase